MYEDEFLEAYYEDRYTIQGDYDVEDDLDFEDEYGTCDICGDPIDYCPGHGYESDIEDEHPDSPSLEDMGYFLGSYAS